jgi:hypothetical protein
MSQGNGLPELADKVRNIPLAEVMKRLDMQGHKEGVSTMYRGNGMAVNITGQKFYDHQAGHGDTGSFFPKAASASEPERTPFPELMRRYGTASPSAWRVARNYLLRRRQLPVALVDRLHADGQLYANNNRPNTGVVFTHQNPAGEIAGATIRGTYDPVEGKPFKQCIGDKLGTWFVIGDLKSARRIVAVESPIEAMSYRALKRTEPGTAIVSVSGAVISEQLLQLAADGQRTLTVAFNNDQTKRRASGEEYKPGDEGWKRCRQMAPKEITLSREVPVHKDWNDDLKATQQQTQGVHIW